MNTQETSERKPIYKRKKFLYAVVILMVIGFIVMLSNSEPRQTSNTNAQPAQTMSNNQSATSDKVSIGEEGYIKVSSPKTILALTQEEYKELTKIYLANDTMGIGEFLLSGKGFAVTNGTKVLVVDVAVGVRKVRALEGDNIGKTGWIAYEWVSKVK